MTYASIFHSVFSKAHFKNVCRSRLCWGETEKRTLSFRILSHFSWSLLTAARRKPQEEELFREGSLRVWPPLSVGSFSFLETCLCSHLEDSGACVRKRGRIRAVMSKIKTTVPGDWQWKLNQRQGTENTAGQWNLRDITFPLGSWRRSLLRLSHCCHRCFVFLCHTLSGPSLLPNTEPSQIELLG